MYSLGQHPPPPPSENPGCAPAYRYHCAVEVKVFIGTVFALFFHTSSSITYILMRTRARVLRVVLSALMTPHSNFRQSVILFISFRLLSSVCEVQ
jgi:hypothetical protein